MIVLGQDNFIQIGIWLRALEIVVQVIKYEKIMTYQQIAYTPYGEEAYRINQ